MIIIILILALILRLINLNQSFWLDEIAQVLESSRSFWQQWDLPIDFHPPLYHYLVYFWLRIGKEEWWLRTTSVFAGMFSVYFTYLFSKKLLDKKIGLFTALFLATSPFHVYYSQELRPYALSCLLAIISFYLFIDTMYEKKKFSFPFVLVNILGLYTLYFFPFVLISQFLFLLFLKREKLAFWAKHTIFSFLAFLPWLPFFINQLKEGSNWARASSVWPKMVSVSLVKSLPLIFIKFLLGRITFDNTVLYLALTIILFLVFLLCLYKAWKKARRSFISLTLLILPILVFSMLIQVFLPIIDPKRLLLLLPIFYCLIVLGIFSFSPKIQKILITIFFIVNAYGLYQQNTNPRFQREAWRQAVSFIEQKTDTKALIFFKTPSARAAWQWYQKKGLETEVFPYDKIFDTGYEKNLDKILAEKQKIFVFQYLFELSDPEDLAGKIIIKKGFKRVKVLDFPGVGLIYEYNKTDLRF